ITGYRGVGKTSFVNQVIRRMRQACIWQSSRDPRTELRLIHIELNLARYLEPAGLMHHIIRRLYETLVDDGVYAELPADVQCELKLDYERTSVNMVKKIASSLERTIGLPELTMESAGVKVGVKSPIASKRGRGLTDEMAFLGYTDH